MAAQQYYTGASNEKFRPPAVTDIPELSRDNILNMLNQIPDLQGRRFNIEYAPPSAPEGYPFPWNMDHGTISYPDPVVIDRLPNEVIQHVKSSNNPALAAALEATLQQEQHSNYHQTFNVQPANVIHHAAESHQQIQQSRPVSSSDSDSSKNNSSSETISSSESDTEELKNIPAARPMMNIPFVGALPTTSFFPHQYR